MRERWREHAFQASLQGLDLGTEPDWDLEPPSGDGDRSDYDSEFEALKRRKKRG